jgi:hypothetical protein
MTAPTATYKVSDAASLNTAIAAADNAAANSGAIEIDITVPIFLGTTALDAINLASGVTLDIEGGNNTINGGGTEQGLFVYAGNVTINNLTIADTVAQGGKGSSGGGGGAGLGGGLFIANDSANAAGTAGTNPGQVTLDNVTFSNDSAKGGNGGGGSDGGGGGLDGGNGGNWGGKYAGSGGGGGIGMGAYGGSGLSGPHGPGIVIGASRLSDLAGNVIEFDMISLVWTCS